MEVENQPDLTPEQLEELEKLQNATWDKIKDEDWEFEYEPLVTPMNHIPKRRPSNFEPEKSETEKTLEWLHVKKELRAPAILTNLIDRTGIRGGSVKLNLALEGSRLKIDWLKDGKPIDRSPKLQPSQDMGMYILTISDLDKSDEGEYTAEIHQGKNVMTTSARVRVLDVVQEKQEKPFAVKIRDFYHTRLNCLVVEAQITGKPRPSAIWYKDDEIIEINDRNRTDETEGDEIYWLLVHDPVPSDSGRYRCEAENASGKCKIEHEVVVDKKLHFINKSGLHHATPKLLSEEEIQAMEIREREIKQKAAERVAIEMHQIQEVLQKEEITRLKRESTTPLSIVSIENLDTPPSPSPRPMKRKEETPQPYVEEPIAIRLSKDGLKWDALLTSRTVSEGSNTKLKCICSGPGSTFKWLKDGKPIKWSERIKNMSEMGMGEVQILNARKEDAGEYTCIAKNGMGSIETSCKVSLLPRGVTKVTSPPSFPRGIKETYSVLKDELTLEVAIRGEPKPTFVWKKDGELIKEDGRISYIREKDDVSVLCIIHPKPEDSGRYSVLATNSEGRKEAIHTVSFTSKAEQGRTTVRGIFHKGSVVKPEDMSLEEIIRLPQPPEKSLPRDPIPEIPSLNTEELLATPVEIIEPKKIIDKPCVSVSHRGAIHQLKFVSQLRDQTAMAGSSVKLQCYVDGPQPSFKWYKSGRPLRWTAICRNQTRDVYGLVEIIKVTEDDSGEYKCVVKNEFNEISTSCKLKVYKNPAMMSDPSLIPPTFTRVMDHYDIITDDLILTIQVRGLPIPELKWIRDGQEIKVDEKYFIMRELQGIYKLCIHNPSKMDAGYYTVKAKNKAGEEQIKHKVEFLGKEHYEYVPLIKHADKHAPYDDSDDENIVLNELETIHEESLHELGEDDGENTMKVKKDPRRWERPKTPTPGKDQAKKIDPKRVLAFETKLRNVTAPEGTNIKLICTVTGPDAIIKWFKNDNSVFWNKSVKNSTKLGIPCLEIFGATPEHSGIYKVTADNGDSQAECECKVTIFENMEATVAPTFTRSIKEYYDIRTNDLILEVHCRGVPRPEIKFIKDSLDVSNADFFEDGKFMISRRSEGIYELQIHAPDKKDSGRYICEASNRAGKNQIAHHVLVKSIPEYTHIRGITSADPKMKKTYNDEELELKFIEREKSLSRKNSLIENETEADQIDPIIKEADLTPEELEAIEINANTPLELLDQTFSEPKFEIKLIAKMKNQMVVEGHSVKLVCSIDGYRPTSKWYKDNQPVQFGKMVKDLSTDTISSIQLMSARLSDAGIYRAVISNKYGQISTFARLRVIASSKGDLGAAPQFSRIRDYYDLPTNQIIVEARILGTQPMIVNWFKNCREIQNDDKFLMAREPGGVHKLYVSNPAHRDSGTYMIKVENQYGTETIKHEVEFWNNEEHLHVHGIAHADPKGKRRVMETVKIEKKKEETSLVEGEEHVIKHRPRTFDPLTKEMEMERAKEKLHLEKPRILQRDPIEFITRLHNQLLPKGSTIKLSCCVTDNNKIEGIWFKDGEPIELGKRIKAATNTDAAICTLEIANATLDDSGVYRCEIKTKKNSIEAECTVTIFTLDDATPEAVPPTFITAVKDYYRPVTNDLVIESKIRGHPRPKIRWQRDGQFVQHSSKYEPYHMEDGTIMLVVNNPKMIDSGRYLIVAENSVKKVELWHEVKFEGKHEDPKKKKWDEPVLENVVHPRVYPKPKEPTPPSIIAVDQEEEQETDQQEYDEDKNPFASDSEENVDQEDV